MRISQELLGAMINTWYVWKDEKLKFQNMASVLWHRSQKEPYKAAKKRDHHFAIEEVQSCWQIRPIPS